MNKKRIAALALALLCAVPVMTACGNGSKERPTISEEDMPYGATMREDSKSFAIPMTYDRRFLEQDEIAKAADMFAAIQNSDAALYQASTFPFYTKYQQEQVYKLDSADALVSHVHSMIAEKSAEDFQYNMVLITGIATNTQAGTLSSVVDMLEAAYDGDGAFLDTVEKSYDMTVEWNLKYNNGADSSVITDQHIFLFKTADGWFAVV
jgi:hypothetical protein